MNGCAQDRASTDVASRRCDKRLQRFWKLVRKPKAFLHSVPFEALIAHLDNLTLDDRKAEGGNGGLRCTLSV